MTSRRLSDDALWLWAELWDASTFGQVLSEEELCERMSDEENVPWAAERVRAAKRELAEARILGSDGEVAPPIIERSVTRHAAGHQALVKVAVEVYSDRNLELAFDTFVEDATLDEVAASLRSTEEPYPKLTRMALFWCDTPDHDEDWFVVAPSVLLARAFFEEEEGHAVGDCTARWVASVSDQIAPHDTEWATDELIIASGGEFISYVPGGGDEERELRAQMGVVTKAVRFGEEVFVAGDIVANVSAHLRKNPVN